MLTNMEGHTKGVTMSDHEPCDWTPGVSEPMGERLVLANTFAGFCLSSDWKPTKEEKLINSSLPPMVGRKQEIVGLLSEDCGSSSESEKSKKVRREMSAA